MERRDLSESGRERRARFEAERTAELLSQVEALVSEAREALLSLGIDPDSSCDDPFEASLLTL